MGKAKTKNISVLLNLINLTVSICILILIVKIARAKADSPITLSNPTVINEQDSGAILSESKTIKIEPKPSEPVVTIDKPAETPISDTEQHAEWQEVRMRVTAYCPCPICCGEYSDGMTACGHIIKPGDTFVAADGRYSFGTKMLIPGYSNSQPVKVLDRGGAIKGNKLDVFFATHQEALEWGVRHLDVKVYH
ncbi:MAG: 3D domain-containing protein [Phycisphaerales bacterium]